MSSIKKNNVTNSRIYSQKSSLKRLWSPTAGRYVGRSNMMAPLLQSWPSSVPVVTWPKKVKIGLAKFNVDAAPVRGRHPDELLPLVVKELPHTLQHLVGTRDIVPLGLLVGVEPADEHVVVGSVGGPLGDGRVGHLVVEVGLVPNVEKGGLSNSVGRLHVLAAVEEDVSGSRLESGDGKGGLEAVLGRCIVGDDIVVAPVKLALVWPPLFPLSEVSGRRSTVEHTQKLAVMYGEIMP